MPQLGENLFEALETGLEDFRAAVDGDPGAKIRALGTVQGPLADGIRVSLAGIYEALVGLERLMDLVQPQLLQLDAGLAVAEVFAAGLKSLAEDTSLGEFADIMGLSREPFEGLARALALAGTAADTVLDLADLLPSPEGAAAIGDQLERLLGTPEEPGQYRALLTDVGVELPSLLPPAIPAVA